MKIHQIYTDNEMRNFTYFIEFANKTAFVIDPWDAEKATKFLNDKKLKLNAIINTHEHWDHIRGNQELVDLHRCEVWAHKNGKGEIPGLSRILEAGEMIDICTNCSMEVLDTPGHSHAHLCFLLHVNNIAKYFFSGDILFNAGVGNCHNGGDVNNLYETINKQIANLPDDVVVFPGHDYLKNNLEFTLNREPKNYKAELWLKKYSAADIHTNPLTTTMADEREINTFLRLDNKEIIDNLTGSTKTNKEVFVALRKLRNNW